MANNVFGITFRGSLTESSNNAYGTQFYAACNTFGINPFAIPSKTPAPIAVFDFNNYTANSPTIADEKGGGPATVILENANYFDTTTSGNYFLDIYAPNNFPNPTGGISLPNFMDIRAIEVWVNYPVSEVYGQYVLDARTGAANGFWITQTGGDTIGSDWDAGKLYNNTVETVIDSGAGTPQVANGIAGSGWRQLIFIPPTPIADDVHLFIKNDGVLQGMPVSVAYIGVYTTDLTAENVKTIFNSKCSRYGLSPV